MGSNRDSGYAWVVLAAAFLCQAFSVGFSAGCIGVWTMSFATVFPNATSNELSWIGSLRGSCQLLASILAVPLAERLGYRKVAVAGALLASVNVALTIFATSIWHIYLSFGILGGIGIACPFSISMAILGEYFDRRKHIAFPAVGFGQGVGSLVFPSLLQAIIESAGHAHSLLFSAFVIGATAIFSITFKPLEGELLSSDCLRTAAATRCSASNAASLTAEAAVASAVASDGVVCRAVASDDRRQPLADDRAAEAAEAVYSTASSVGSETRIGILGLLSKWVVWAHILCPLFWGVCSSAVEALWPLTAMSYGISAADAALGAMLTGVGFLASAILTTVLGQRQYDRCLLYMVSVALCGSSVLALSAVPLAVPSYLALSALFGWWLGFVVSLFMSVLAGVVQPRDLADLIALYNFSNGIGYFVGPVLIGSLGTVIGRWNWLVCGVFSIAASLVVLPPYIACRRRTTRAAIAAAAVPAMPWYKEVC